MTENTRGVANRNAESVTRYVLLVRHASRDKKWELPEAWHPMAGWREDFHSAIASPPKESERARDATNCVALAEPKKSAVTLTRELAGILCDQLEIQKIRVNRMLYSEHTVAKQTAAVFGNALTRRFGLDIEFKSLDLLTPVSSSKKAKTNTLLVSQQIQPQGYLEKEHEDHAECCLVIGHQPQITIIARNLLDKSLWRKKWGPFWFWAKIESRIFSKGSLPGNVLPLGSSEIACIQLGKDPRLLWLITEKSPELLAELKAKIASKFDVAKFFLGALVVGTGLTLSDAVWNLPNRNGKMVAGFGAFAALCSLGLTAATLFSYDRLQMPQDFWLGVEQEDRKSASPPWTVSRPPSQAHVILFYEMVHIWTHLFIPAMVSAFLAMALVVAARAHSSLTVPRYDWIFDFIVYNPLITCVLLALFALMLGWIAFLRWKPRLGFPD